MPTIERIQLPPDGSTLKRDWWGQRDLQAMYLMNHGAGTRLFDLSGHERHGTIYGATWGGQGLGFDGSNDYVALPGVAWPSGTAWTVTVLAPTLPAYDTGRFFLSAYNTDSSKYVVGIYRSNLSATVYAGGGAVSGASISAVTGGSSVCLSVVRSGTVLSGYRNGASAFSGVATPADIATGGTVLVGNRTGGSWYYLGSIALVAIHSRAQSAAEQAQLYRELMNFEMFETPSQAYRRRLLA